MRRVGHVGAVTVEHVRSLSVHHHSAPLDPDGAVAQLAHDAAVRDDEEGQPLFAQFRQARRALFGKGGVADGEDLVDEHDLRFHVDGDGKAEARHHTRRIRLYGRVDKVAQFGKVEYVRKFCLDLFFGVAHDGGVEEDVLHPRGVAVEPRAQPQQGRDAPVKARIALRRLHDAGNDLQKGALAHAVAADERHRLPLVHLKADIFEADELFALQISLQRPHHPLFEGVDAHLVFGELHGNVRGFQHHTLGHGRLFFRRPAGGGGIAQLAQGALDACGRDAGGKIHQFAAALRLRRLPNILRGGLRGRSLRGGFYFLRICGRSLRGGFYFLRIHTACGGRFLFGDAVCLLFHGGLL